VSVVGGGIFGVTAALALRKRGHDVTVFDPGPIPHPLAESTDISKIVRLDYGDDETYTTLMEKALEGWRRWSAAPLFHETGLLFLRRSPLEPGSFEHDSYELLTRRGHRLERLDASAIRERFPAWNAGSYVDGYFNPEGGWAESGRVVAHLAREAADAGVRLAPGTALAGLVETAGRVTGFVTAAGDVVASDFVVVAAGSWTPHLLPFLREHLHSVGQPVFHLAPADPARFEASRFPVFGADIARTGYYGFCANADGIVKIANHGVGRAMHPEAAERAVTAAETEALRAFLQDAIPELASAPIVATRVCVYCDTWDQHFWIAPDPDRAGLVVAAGGSGHAFKLAPMLGELIAEALEGKVVDKFKWRTDVARTKGEERARHQGR
jgi:glycine/D-amino acid oxidase-like deaminating enzyme